MSAESQPPGGKECEIFLGALEQASPADRRAYLDRACAGDPTLRAAVDDLLENHKEDGFLETPALRSDATTTVRIPPGESAGLAAARELPGDRIGRYKLLQTIGEGGVGTVFLAEQEEPVRRRVALKVIKPGMDTKSVIARFESERQALALMDHPHIAKVLDAGATGTGRPYFVMELVRGMRITDFCDHHRLSTRERLELFIAVCQAIQHAHLKGIIHRDIKPSNVLVTISEGPSATPCPKVIDFGIAKATAQRLTDKTLLTELHAFIGTPAYMSPEQAEMGGLDLDTRTDIYSLGVLLYELLTGAPPFDGAQLMASGLDDMRRTIREREPVRPSTRLRAMLASDQAAAAQRHQSEPSKLLHLLRGDLDWIVLKALEKDRARRYETASSLAADVQRFLNNEPILARPPSTTYRCSKFVRRNKLGFGIGAAFAVALVLGLALSTWQYLEKSRAYQRATDAERAQGVLRAEAERQALAARRKAYAADMNLVQQALLANNLGRAQELLAAQIPSRRHPLPATNAPVDLRGWEWRYLWYQCQTDAAFTLCQQSNEVSALTVSADGRWLAIGDAEGGISLWDLPARSETTRWQTGGGRVQIAFSPVAPWLAFSAAEGDWFPDRRQRVRIWDATTRQTIVDLPAGGPCVRLAFSADGTRLAVATADEPLTLWSLPEGRLLRSWPLPEAARLGPVQLSPGFDAVAYGTDAGTVCLLDLDTGQQRWSAQAADETVTALAFSPDGKTLASGAGFVESTIRLWDVTHGTPLARLEGHRTWVGSLAFRSDGSSLVSASGDQTIRLWDLSGLRSMTFRPAGPGPDPARSPADPTARPPGAGPGRRSLPPWLANVRPTATFRGHQQEVWCLALLPDNARIVSGCRDGSVCVWDTAQRRRDQAQTTLPGPVRAWRFAPDSQSLLTVDAQGNVLRWAGTAYHEARPEFALGEPVTGALLSPDARWIAATLTNGNLGIWDVQRRTRAHLWETGDSRTLAVGFMPPENHLLTRRTGETTLQAWDLATGEEVDSWLSSVEIGPRSAVAFSQNARWSFLLDADGAGRLRNLVSQEETSLDPHLKQIAQVAFAPDGRHFAAVSRLGTGCLWSTVPPEQTATLHGFLQGMNAVAFSPDGNRLAIGGDGNEAVKLWDVDSLQELLTLEGRGSTFAQVAFSPDGNLLAASNGQGLLHVWRAPDLREIEQTQTARP